MKEKKLALPTRIISSVLAALQILTAVVPVAVMVPFMEPRAYATPGPNSTDIGGQNVVVNHRPGFTAPQTVLPAFSSPPNAADFFKVQIFPIALVPIGIATIEENQALAIALQDYVQRTNLEDESILVDYIDKFPNSAWKPALLLNLGIIWRQSGYFSKAMDAWETAWTLSKRAQDIRGKAIADRSVAEFAQINAWVGRFERLKPLFAEIGDRKLIGPAAERLLDARDGLLSMQKNPGAGFLCGPYALEQIVLSRTNAPSKGLMAARSTMTGFSLAQLQQLSDQIGLNYQMAKRTVGSEVITNSVVHWKLNHYGALIKEDHGRFLIRDSTFGHLYGQELWISKAALDEESDGYFLVRAGKLPDGWRPVDFNEGERIFGRGAPDGRNATAYTPNDTKPPCPRKNENADDTDVDGSVDNLAMPGYSFHLMLVSLNIIDTPLRYKPPVGPAVKFRVTYNQRESFLSTPANYPNLGPQWTFDWLTYISDSGKNASGVAQNSTVSRYVSGGGLFDYSLVSGSTSQYTADIDEGALSYNSSSDTYTLTYPNGAQKVFSYPSTTASGVPRKLFLTYEYDEAGNKLSFYYDSNERLYQVTDAIGQPTIIHYDSTADIYKITSVEDPFHRRAYFQYNLEGYLQKITDEIGMSSSFMYDGGNMITNMTTPYGITSFSYSDGGSTDTTGQAARWILATDPAGEQEYVYSPDTTTQTTSIPVSESDDPGTAGTAYPFEDAALEERNSFYFDKPTMSSVGNSDLNNSTIYHWLHDQLSSGSTLMSGLPESIKSAQSSRVWYCYPGQLWSTYSTGITSRKPSVVARAVEDPTGQSTCWWQFYQYQYNNQGRLTQYTDPAGRQTTYDYYPNGVDLQRIRQTTGTVNETLAQFGAFNMQHRPSSYVDTAGQTYNLTWNLQGQLTQVANPLNQLVKYTYDANNYLKTVAKSDPSSGLSLTTQITYDSFGRPQTVTGASEYTASGENYALTYNYDNLDRVTQITYPDSTFEKFVYNKLNLFAEYDRAGYRTVFTYDPDGRPLTKRDRLNRLTQFSWCGCGGLASITDPNGNTTGWRRDFGGRITSKTFMDNSIINYAYEPRSGRLQTVTDALSQAKHFTYDVDDTVTNITYQRAINATPSVTFTYDPVYARLVSMVDGNGETDYTYKPVNVLGAGKVATEHQAFTGDTVVYSYDALGRMTSRSIDSVNEGVTFDGLGRVLTHTSVLGESDTYYVANSIATVRPMLKTLSPYQAAFYSYYNSLGDNRLAGITNGFNPYSHIRVNINPYSAESQLTYDKVGRMTQFIEWQAYSPGSGETCLPIPHTNTYDAEGQLLESTAIQSQSYPAIFNPQDYAYAYDPAGNRINEQVQNGNLQSENFPGPSGSTVSDSVEPVDASALALNDLNQLTSRISSGSVPVRVSGSVNEPSTVTVNGQSVPVTADPNNAPGGELFSTWINLAQGASTVPIVASTSGAGSTTQNAHIYLAGGVGPDKSFSYDMNGNCTGYTSTGGNVIYQWDAENRLAEIDNGSSTSRFTYDGFGRRVQIVELNSGAVTSTKRFVWSGTKMCEERDGNNNVTKRFFAEGEQISGNNYYFTYNHLGNVQTMSDANGSIMAQYSYDPYGNRVRVGGFGGDADFGFAGYYVHAPSGLYLTLFRAYDPDTGRWLSRDPIAENGGLNLYDYVLNSPIDLVDPYGLVNLNLTANLSGLSRNDAALSKYADSFNPPGFYSVAGHGSPDSIEGSDGKSLDAEGLLGLMIANGYQYGQPIWLLSCNTGSTPDGLAQNLATLAHATVNGPNDLAWPITTTFGDPLVAPELYPNGPPDMRHPGGWASFNPVMPYSGGGQNAVPSYAHD